MVHLFITTLQNMWFDKIPHQHKIIDYRDHLEIVDNFNLIFINMNVSNCYTADFPPNNQPLINPHQ